MPVLKPPRGIQLNKSHPLARNLEGSWLINDGTGLTCTDTSGGRNHGTLYGGAFYTAGRFGHSIDFQGINEYVNAPKTKNIFGGDITISFWIKVKVRVVYARYVTFYYDGTNYIQIACGNNNYLAAIGKYGSGTERGTEINNKTWESLNTWIHIVAVWKASDLAHKFYVDGKAEGVTSTSGWGIGTNTGLTLGARNTFGGSWTNGRIDNVMMWSRELSASEVVSLYINPFQMYDYETGMRKFGDLGGAPPAGLGIPIAAHHYKLLGAA